MKRKAKVVEYVEYFLPLVLLLTLWHFATSGDTYNEVLFPKLTTIIETFVRKLQDLSLLSALGTSLLRVLKGYLLAAVCGISIGIMIGLSNRF
mgnify:CR=1 FL=1